MTGDLSETFQDTSQAGDLATAIDDVFSVLPPEPEAGEPQGEIWRPALFLDIGGRLKPVDLNGRDDEAARRKARAFLATLEPGAGPVCFGVDGPDLILRTASLTRSRSSFIAVLAPDAFAAFLAGAFPDVGVSRALRRVLLLHLAGLSLKDGAALDGRSIDTRKRQSQQLRAAFGIDDLATIGRQVSSALVLALDRLMHPQHNAVGRSISAYVERYMPPETRLFALSDKDGAFVTMLDLGPVGGQPVIVLHAMALPDIRAQDLMLLDRLGLRLIWPLRHGICTPDAVPLPPDEHFDHALKGATLALQLLGGGAAPVVCFAAASKLGVELAQRQPNAVSALHVAGVCVREGRPESGARRLARGVLALAARNPALLDPILGRFEAHLRRPGVLETFMKRQFLGSAADLAIVNAELQGPHGSRRFRDALLDSAASARHDFLFQNDLGWDDIPADTPVHLHHGALDCIHPMPLIEHLAARLPNAELHVHPEAGQLFYHDHFEALFSMVAATGRDAVPAS